MQPEPQVQSRHDVHEVVAPLARSIALLQPGDLAKLRRTPPGAGGSGPFWRLFYHHALQEYPGRSEAWEGVMQAIAILTPTGRPEGKHSAHNPTVSFGAALVEAGVSEQRVLSLLAQSLPQRRVTLTRLCRRLARVPAFFKLDTLVNLYLFEAPYEQRRLARDFFSALEKS